MKERATKDEDGDEDEEMEDGKDEDGTQVITYYESSRLYRKRNPIAGCDRDRAM